MNQTDIAQLCQARASKSPRRKGPPDEELVRMYVVLGWGTGKIAKETGMNPSGINRHLKRLGVLDSSRRSQPSGVPQRERRPASLEFTATVRKLRFEQEHGLCQECHQPIGDGTNWRQACYHHIVSVSQGGGREPENCMVLHSECHYDPVIFQRLHGFPLRQFSSKVQPRRTRDDNAKLPEAVLIAEFLGGAPVMGIAKRHDMAYPALYRRLRRLESAGKIPTGLLRTQTLSDDELWQLHLDGVRNAHIAQRFGLTDSNISARLKRLQKKVIK